MEHEIKKLVQELFINGVCREYLCGSQHCDCSEDWLEGCRLYKGFEADVEDVISKTLGK